jgi:ectoine hydroxylase-related dioxygenase (phytanoyl-CoA dioxygenase family)
MTAGKDIDRFLAGRSFADARRDFDRDGYVVFRSVLGAERVAALRGALAPYLERDVRGRNEFEGPNTNRVYAMLAKSPLFAELVVHPLALAFVEADLGEDCLLSACLAINLKPGAAAQPWHYDDSHYGWPRPRPALGVSAFWTLDATTGDNGATEIIPRSHLWGADAVEGSVAPEHFRAAAGDSSFDPGARGDAVKAVMPAGSLLLAKGTLWHRGGANRSNAPRLIITPQYCPGWTRPLENMSLAAPPPVARRLPVRAQELLGYSIRPPFMGYVDGRHPKRLLES